MNKKKIEKKDNIVNFPTKLSPVEKVQQLFCLLKA